MTHSSPGYPCAYRSDRATGGGHNGKDAGGHAVSLGAEQIGIGDEYIFEEDFRGMAGALSQLALDTRHRESLHVFMHQEVAPGFQGPVAVGGGADGEVGGLPSARYEALAAVEQVPPVYLFGLHADPGLREEFRLLHVGARRGLGDGVGHEHGVPLLLRLRDLAQHRVPMRHAARRDHGRDPQPGRRDYIANARAGGTELIDGQVNRGYHVLPGQPTQHGGYGQGEQPVFADGSDQVPIEVFRVLLHALVYLQRLGFGVAAVEIGAVLDQVYQLVETLAVVFSQGADDREILK